MPKFAFLCVALILLTGCATTTHNTNSNNDVALPAKGVAVRQETVSSEVEVPEGVTPLSDEKTVENVPEVDDSQEAKIPLGTVFGKIKFTGIFNTSYISLSIVGITDPNYKFKLFIGDKAQTEDTSRKVQILENGYFFMDLPPGQYQITSVAIPVSSTMAVEPIDIIFDVSENQVDYLGHLTIEGTKEKIHWGGIPVVKPGFEYFTVLKHDEWESYNLYRRLFPESQIEPKTKLMVIRPVKLDDPLP